MKNEDRNPPCPGHDGVSGNHRTLARGSNMLEDLLERAKSRKWFVLDMAHEAFELQSVDGVLMMAGGFPRRRKRTIRSIRQSLLIYWIEYENDKGEVHIEPFNLLSITML